MTLPMLYAFVVGDPAPKGSKKFVGRARNGRGIMVESSKKAKPWAALVSAGILDKAGRPIAFFEDAARVTLEFVLERPAYLDKGKHPKPTPHHTKKKGGDLDKLIRCTLDAITTSGAWRDDSQACEMHTFKRYAEPGEPTGCMILIEALPEKEKPHGIKTQWKTNSGSLGRRDSGGGQALARAG